jgi:hypothetical protein
MFARDAAAGAYGAGPYYLAKVPFGGGVGGGRQARGRAAAGAWTGPGACAARSIPSLCEPSCWPYPCCTPARAPRATCAVRGDGAVRRVLGCLLPPRGLRHDGPAPRRGRGGAEHRPGCDAVPHRAAGAPRGRGKGSGVWRGAQGLPALPWLPNAPSPGCATSRSPSHPPLPLPPRPQVLHLAVLVTPHQDSAFMVAIGWCAGRRPPLFSQGGAEGGASASAWPHVGGLTRTVLCAGAPST